MSEDSALCLERRERECSPERDRVAFGTLSGGTPELAPSMAIRLPNR